MPKAGLLGKPLLDTRGVDMPTGIVVTSNHAAMRATFEQFTEYNKRSRDFLVQDQARRYATDLYNATADIAPTKAEIAADVKKLGWRIPARFADGRLGRGTAKNWLGYAWDAVQYKKRRGRRTKKSHLEEAAFMAQKPTLVDMQRFVIWVRNQARLYLASGWLGAIVDLGGSVKATSGAVYRDRGGALIRRNQGLLEITIWNRSRGIEDVDAEKHFVAAALAARIAGMKQYIVDHQRAIIQKFRLAA